MRYIKKINESQWGFTLIELLAVIVILAIILSLAIPAYSVYVRRSKNKAYDLALESFKVAASDALTHCMTAPPNELIAFCNAHTAPKDQYNYDIITGSDLVKFNYIDPIVDPEDTSKTCDMEHSYVYISNKANSEEENNYEFVYKVCLICGDRKSEDCRDDILSEIESEWKTSCVITYDEAGTISYDGKWTDQDLYLGLTSSGNYKYGINNYRYQIGEEKWNSVRAVNNAATVRLTRTVGDKPINVETYDGLNQVRKTVCTSSGGTLVKIDKTVISGVTIEGKETDGTVVKSNEWSKTDIILTAVVNPKESASGYIYTWYKDGEVIPGATGSTYIAKDWGNYKVEVTNGVGKQHITSEEFVVKIDRKAPTCELIVTGNKSGEWYIGDVTIDFKTVNDLEDSGVLGSGIKKQELSHTIINTDSELTTVTGTVTDNVGRKGTCSATVKRDAKTPSATPKRPTLPLGNGSYDFKDNLNVDFGPSGGTVVCKPPTSLKTGTYTVTCTLTSNANRKQSTVSFLVRHSYMATYVSRTCSRQENCREETYCTEHEPCDPWGCWCGPWPDGCCEYNPSSTCCVGPEVTTTVCETVYYNCSYYTCPNGGTLSGSTCNY